MHHPTREDAVALLQQEDEEEGGGEGGGGGGGTARATPPSCGSAQFKWYSCDGYRGLSGLFFPGGTSLSSTSIADPRVSTPRASPNSPTDTLCEYVRWHKFILQRLKHILYFGRGDRKAETKIMLTVFLSFLFIFQSRHSVTIYFSWSSLFYSVGRSQKQVLGGGRAE